MKTPPCFEDPETKKIIRAICEEHNIDPVLLKDLCETVNEHSGFAKRFGLPDDIEVVLDRFVARAKES